MAQLCEKFVEVERSKLTPDGTGQLSAQAVWAESMVLPAILNHLGAFSKEPRECIDGAAVDCMSFSSALRDALAAADSEVGVTDVIEERVRTSSDKAPLLASGIPRRRRSRGCLSILLCACLFVGVSGCLLVCFRVCLSFVCLSRCLFVCLLRANVCASLCILLAVVCYWLLCWLRS